MKANAIVPFLLGVLMVFTMNAANANDEKYQQAMKKNIEAVYAAQSVDDLQLSVNAFDRIASAEKSKWEPLYYAAFGYILMGNRDKDPVKKDAWLDEAVKRIEQAKVLAPGESEIVALEGFASMIRVTVDPGTRGPQFAGLAMQSFGKANGMNPENPRALLLMAQMQFGTAQFFGSPTTEACATLQKAFAKFETYKPDNALAPQWGKSMAEGLKAECK